MKRAALLTLALLAGCAYYNGMYNAKRLTGAAEKAEREGRTLDASSYWGQVAVKAESVVVRHPDSKWVDQALLLRGVALSHLGQCSDAVRPLEEAAVRLQETELREQAQLTLAECRAQLGDSAAAAAGFAALVNSRIPAHRREARLAHARSLVAAGDYRSAVLLLDSLPGPEARRLRLIALGGTGAVGPAGELTDSLLAEGDTATNWPAYLNAVASRDPRLASRLTDTLMARLKLTRLAQAGWLLADGRRLLPVDSLAGMERLRQAADAGGERPDAWNARLTAALFHLRQAASTADLSRLRPPLDTLARGDGLPADSSARLLRRIDRLLAADSVAPGAPQGDLRLFYAAETARDSLGLPAVAAGLFRRVAREWPDSPYAPKALLVLIQLDPGTADSTRDVLVDQYPDSPYLAIVRGDSAPGYRALEDSMLGYSGLFAAGTPAPAQGAPREVVRPGRATPPPAAPTTGRRLPDDAP